MKSQINFRCIETRLRFYFERGSFGAFDELRQKKDVLTETLPLLIWFQNFSHCLLRLTSSAELFRLDWERFDSFGPQHLSAAQ